MEQLIESVASYSALAVPMLAMWAIACLYTARTGCQCTLTQIAYFVALLAISGLTVRTVLVDDGCWLIHTASLGVMIVSGVMRRPAEREVLRWNSAL